MKVDASDELEQELQEDVEEERAAAAAAASKQAHDKSSKSNKSSKPNSHRTSSSSSKHRTKGVSVMDRLGPPRHNKRPRSGSEDLDRRRESLNHRNGSPNHRHDVPNGKHVEPNSKHEAPKSKRRVVNLLEESSFPPRRSEKKSSSSSSRSDKKTLSSKGRVRPLSVVERSGRGGGSSPRSNALASVVARQRDQGSDGTASGSEEEEELGLSQPSTAAVQSKVEVTGRDRRTNSAAGGKTRAPNTSLILRAVADAHRSVTTTSSAPKRTSTHLHDEHKPSSKKPKMEVFSRSYREREEGRLTSSSGSSSSSVAAAAAAAAAAAELKEGGKLQKLSITVPNPPRPSARKDVSSDDSDSAADRRNRSSRPGASVLSKQRLGERIEGSSLRYRVSDTMIDEIEEEHLTAEDVSRLHHHNTEPTLLLQPQPLQQMHNVDEVEEYIEEVEEWEEDVESVGTAASIDPTAGILLPATATVAAGVVAAPPINPLLMSLDELVHQNNVSSETKYTTRCIFWPACRLAEKCQYQHPTMPCKLFPNCTFGDKCLYIHPNCKYDAQCTRPDCSFTHATRSVPALNAPVIPAKSKLSLNAVPGPARATGGVMGRRCHFGLKCTNVNCPFLHPKPCKFGNACPIPGCQFTHPDFTTGSKLKWVAPKLGAANATATGAVPVATFTTTTGAVPAGVFTTATGAVPAAGFITKVDVPTASVPTTALSSSITAARPTHGSDPYVYIRKQTPVAAETTAVAAPAAENTSSNSLTESQPSDNKLTATNGCNKKAEDGVVVTLRTKKTPITVD
uniref:Zinc finger CCCH domain-containing protein 14 n=1 Tax=Hirondellea gigas TaxID=1518452 RepID=A0A6A7FXI2_9CRUS